MAGRLGLPKNTTFKVPFKQDQDTNETKSDTDTTRTQTPDTTNTNDNIDQNDTDTNENLLDTDDEMDDSVEPDKTLEDELLKDTTNETDKDNNNTNDQPMKTITNDQNAKENPTDMDTDVNTNDDTVNNTNTNTNNTNESDHTLNTTENSDPDYDSATDLRGLTQVTPDRPKSRTTDHHDSQDDDHGTPSTYHLLRHTIPTHLHNTFQNLNTLKEKLLKTKTTLDNLTTHKDDGTLPKNLSKITDCHITLDDDLRYKWEQASKDASRKQLDLLIEQHQRKLRNFEQKITHNTQTIQNGAIDEYEANDILKQTEEISKRYSARWLSKHNRNKRKTTKRLTTKTPHDTTKKPTTLKHGETITHKTSPNSCTPTHNITRTTPQNYPITPLYPQTQTKSHNTTRAQRPQPNPFFNHSPRPQTPQRLPNYQPQLPSTPNSLLNNHIQQQIRNFLRPTHLLNYLQQHLKYQQKRK